MPINQLQPLPKPGETSETCDIISCGHPNLIFSILRVIRLLYLVVLVLSEGVVMYWAGIVHWCGARLILYSGVGVVLYINSLLEWYCTLGQCWSGESGACLCQ